MAIASSAPALETLSGHHVPTDYAMARYKPVDRNPRLLPVVLSTERACLRNVQFIALSGDG